MKLTVDEKKLLFYYIIIKIISYGKQNYLKEFNYINQWITNEGLVTWVPEVRLQTKCQTNIKDFLFDKCVKIKFNCR